MLVEIVAAGVVALTVMAPGDSIVVPATIAAFSAALAPGHRLTGHVVPFVPRLQINGVGLIVVIQNTYWSEMFPLVATGWLAMLMICLAGRTVPPDADPLQGVPAGSVNVNTLALAVPAVLLIL